MERNVLISLLTKLGAKFTEKIAKARAITKITRYIEKKGVPAKLTADETEALIEMGVDMETAAEANVLSLDAIILSVGEVECKPALNAQVPIKELASRLDVDVKAIKKLIKTDDYEDITLSSENDVFLTLTGKKKAQKLLKAVKKAVQKMTKKTAPRQSNARPRRVNIICNALSNITKAISIEDLATSINKDMITAGGKDNPKQALHHLRVILPVAVNFDVIAFNTNGEVIKG